MLLYKIGFRIRSILLSILIAPFAFMIGLAFTAIIPIVCIYAGIIAKPEWEDD